MSSATSSLANWPNDAVKQELKKFRILYGEPKQLFVGRALWNVLCEAFDSKNSGFNFSGSDVPIPIRLEESGLIEPHEFIFSSF